MTATLNKIIEALLAVFLFLLPWQTRLVYAPAFLNGAAWEYGTLSVYATELLLGLIVILALFDLIRRRVWRTVPEPARARHRLVGFGAAFLFLLLLIFNSQAPAISAQWVSWLIGGAAAAALLLVYGAGHLKFPVAFWLGGVGQGLFAIYQFFTQEVVANKWLGLAAHTPWQLGDFVIEAGSGRWLRAYGAFGSPNILGGYLAVCLVLGLVMWVRLARPLPGPPLCEGEGAQNPLCRGGGGRGRIWSAITIGQLIILSGLLFSFSRGAWVAAVAGGLALAVAARQSPDRALFKVLLLRQFVFSVALVLVLIIVFKPLFLARFTAAGRLEQKSLASRANQYQEFKQVFSARPLLGVGPGAYTLALYQLDSERPSWRYQPVHNSYLLLAAELGVIGLLLFLLVHWRLWRHIKKHQPLWLAVLVALFASALFDHFWWSLYGGVMMWFVIVGLFTAKAGNHH